MSEARIENREWYDGCPVERFGQTLALQPGAADSWQESGAQLLHDFHAPGDDDYGHA